MSSPSGPKGLSSTVDANDTRERGISVTTRSKHKGRAHLVYDTLVPRAQQMLGRDWYWREFRAAAMGNPSPMWKTMVRAGDEKVEFKL